MAMWTSQKELFFCFIFLFLLIFLFPNVFYEQTRFCSFLSLYLYSFFEYSSRFRFIINKYGGLPSCRRTHTYWKIKYEFSLIFTKAMVLVVRIQYF
jgi:hypothetical protein